MRQFQICLMQQGCRAQGDHAEVSGQFPFREAMQFTIEGRKKSLRRYCPRSAAVMSVQNSESTFSSMRFEMEAAFGSRQGGAVILSQMRT